MNVAITIDLEHDCPPYLHTYEGMETGAGLFLELMRRLGIPATCFATGDVARRYPEVMERIVAQGHELACHGDTHRRFSTMLQAEAEDELSRSSETLRTFALVTSFRAPNLDFPDVFLPLLTSHGYSTDSSLAAYKWHQGHPRHPLLTSGLLRLPASTMPSVVRLPKPLRTVLMLRCRDPLVLFFHPWEFIDMRKTPIPLDCRFGTGQRALDTLSEVISDLQQQGGEFLTLSDLARRVRPTLVAAA